ncbi:glycosyltransferase [Desulfobulbus oralis]|nr:glycosyltransferase [Desulfobulbus oralis]
MNSALKATLKQYYHFHENTGLWQPAQAPPFSYSDGDDQENALLQTVRSLTDRSVFSPELFVHQKDWPSFYHLSPQRTNLLRPLAAHLRNARVLELGCGCGALTRFLGEANALEVCAVEGSARRAEITAARCSSLNNVVVIADQIQNLSEKLGKFDVVTLVGVLEYAAVFDQRDNAALALLQQARSFLKADGFLVLALENKLGLKYFAGVPEEHLNIAWGGIAGAYGRHTAETFSRKQLLQMLQQAGFGLCEQFIPAPDYKLPVSIITPTGIEAAENGWHVGSLLDSSRPFDVPPIFNLPEAWRSVLQAGLLAELANSMCFVAHAEQKAPQSVWEKDVLAFHYGVPPRNEKRYAKCVRFKQGSNTIQVLRKRLEPEMASEGAYRFCPTSESYIEGEEILERGRRVVSRPGWTVQEFCDALKPWMEEIKKNLDAAGTLPPGFVDASPFNARVNQEGTLQFFDQEWHASSRVPFLPVVINHLYCTIDRLGGVRQPNASVPLLYPELILAVLKSFGFSYSLTDLRKAWENPDTLWPYVAKKVHIWTEIQKELSVTPSKSIDIAYAHKELSDSELSVTQQQYFYEKINNFRLKGDRDKLQKILNNVACRYKNMGSVSWRPLLSPEGKHADTIRCQVKTLLNRVIRKKNSQLQQLKQLLQAIPLFDPHFYRQNDPALQLSRSDLVSHYFFYGASEGRNPNPYFFTSWYLAEYPDVAASGLNPFLHFLLYGLAEGRNPNPYFWTTWYLDKNPQVKKQGIHPLVHYQQQGWREDRWPNPYFNPTWYAETYLKANDFCEPLAHFLSHSGEFWYNPNPYFWTSWYLQKYPWIKAMNMHPLQYYIVYGAQEDTSPNPYFDAIWYQQQYSEAINNEIAFTHYLEHSNWKNTNPNPYFDTTWYLEKYPDVKENGLDPLLHFHLFGAKENRCPGPHFDTSWYLDHYPDIKQSGINPLLHFLEFGQFEGRNPNQNFDTGWYLSHYLDQLPTNLSPFLHYLQKGQKQGLLTHDPNQPELTYSVINYHTWYKNFYALNDSDRLLIQKQIAEFSYTPCISLVMTVNESNANFLIAAIESVNKQLYPHWELCIVNVTSTDGSTAAILQKFKSENNRIKIIPCLQKEDRIQAANSALELASGEFVAFLGKDDLLTEDALFWVTEALNRHPDASLIYSDEDTIDENNELKEAYFKSDWDPWLFRSHNLISHLGVYRRKILMDIGGLRTGHEGSQDYALATQAVEHIESSQIIHIPRVLYHSRTNKNIINEQPKGVSQTFTTNTNENQPLASIIIPTRNAEAVVRQCIDSIIQKTIYKNYEIILVDNGSDDNNALIYFKQLADKKLVRLLRYDGIFNYSHINNIAVSEAKGDIVVLLNNDTEIITNNWLSQLVSLALLPGVGAVSAKLLYPNRTIQHSGVILGLGRCAEHVYKGLPKDSNGYHGQAQFLRSYSAVTGACLAVRKAVYKEVGGLDEVNFAVGYNDVDFCLKLREHGYTNLCNPEVVLIHHESISRGKDETPEKITRFWNEISLLKKRWPNVWYHDPAYNPNLTLSESNYSRARIPRTQLSGQHWPAPFTPLWAAPKSPGLRLLLAVPDGSESCRLLMMARQLVQTKRISSYAAAHASKFFEVSPEACAWFDVVCLSSTSEPFMWFERGIKGMLPYLIDIEDLAPFEAAPDLGKDNAVFQNLVHATWLTSPNHDLIHELETLYGLNLQAYSQEIITATPDPPDSGQTAILDAFLHSLLKIRTAEPIPACQIQF